MAVFYGSDTHCVTGFDKIDVQVTSASILVGERVARSLQIERGALAAINDDPNRGFNVRSILNAKLSPASIGQYQQLVRNECLKDEEVLDATVTITPVSGGGVSIAISLTGAAGPFLLTMNVNQLTTTAVFNF